MPKHIRADSDIFKGTIHIRNITIIDSDRPWYIQSNDTPWRNCVDDLTLTFADGITHIPPQMFHELPRLRNLVISDTVHSLEPMTFTGCNGLTELTIPISLNAHGTGDRYEYWAIGACHNLQKVVFTPGTGEGANYVSWAALRLPWSHDSSTSIQFVFQEGIESIGDYTFYQCCAMDGDVTLPESVTRIGSSSFSYCYLTSITLGSSFAEIGGNAFERCSSLISVIFSDQGSRDERTMSVGGYAFSGCGVLTSLPVNARLGYIEHNAFENCKCLASVAFADTLTTIGDGAFWGCVSLETLSFPASLASIGFGAFKGCMSITSVSIPDSVGSIGELAFRGCTALRSVRLPSGLTAVPDGMFEDCSSLCIYNLPDSLDCIGSGAFRGCLSIDSVVIGGSVRTVGEGAFSGCFRIMSLTIPSDLDAVVSASDPVFGGCDGVIHVTFTMRGGGLFEYGAEKQGHAPWVRARTVSIPEGIGSIPDAYFARCPSLEFVALPSTLASIGAGSFEGCISLERVVIPDSVISMGAGAFRGCTGIRELTLPADLDAVSSASDPVFGDGKGITDVTFTMRGGGLLEYDAEARCNVPWRYASRITISEGVESIPYAYFTSLLSLWAVSLPSSLESIGASAFESCRAL